MESNQDYRYVCWLKSKNNPRNKNIFDNTHMNHFISFHFFQYPVRLNSFILRRHRNYVPTEHFYEIEETQFLFIRSIMCPKEEERNGNIFYLFETCNDTLNEESKWIDTSDELIVIIRKRVLKRIHLWISNWRKLCGKTEAALSATRFFHMLRTF